MKIVYSKNNILIRLTDERWSHIIENHDELAGRIDDILNTIAEPDIIVKLHELTLVASSHASEERNPSEAYPTSLLTELR